MSEPYPLEGKRILVVEDDYYLASDEKLLLEQAGAQVLGPFGTGYGKDDLPIDAKVDGALIDINLGYGPCFELAQDLRERGVPFVFVTGYNADVIPIAFSDVPRLEKPADPRELISTLAEQLHAGV